MSSRVWLLVEWVDENNVFPEYSVVNVDTMAYGESDLHPGNLIFVCLKRENPRRAKILRMSDNKRYLKEHKEILERQDQQVKNVLQLCMRTIKEMKSETVYTVQPNTSNNSALPPVFVAHDDNSSSDSDSETRRLVHHNRIQNFNSLGAKYSIHHSRPTNQNSHHQRAISNEDNPRQRPIISSTPIARNVAQDNMKLYFDQATQTDNSYLQPSITKIEEMEVVLRNLYRRFQSLVTHANLNTNGSISMSDTEQIDDTSYDLQPTIGQLWAEDDNIECDEQRHPRYVLGGLDVNALEENGELQTVNQNISNIKGEDEQTPNTVVVRRMSAQTTNNIEAVTQSDIDLMPIGIGNAKVPARLLNDIDWNSYTNATRQLLQALFPRKVLATHSLTGKQSPAFLNRPPKKILDPKLVDDIVKTVSTRCGVPKNLVRNSITIKCTDEAKLYRNRQRYRQGSKNLGNDENAPPSTPSSDESTNITTT